MADPLARVELLARSLREASAGGATPRWLLLSRFGVDFLGVAVRPTRPTEVERFGLLRLANLRDIPLLVLDRDPAEAGDDALEDALAVFAAGRAGMRGVIQCVAAATLEPAVPAPSIALVRDWIRWGDEDPMRGLPAARLGARYPDLRGWRDAEELAALTPALAARGVRGAIAVARRGPTGASGAEFEAMRRLGGELVVEAGAAEMIAALQQGLRGVTLALVLDAALQSPPADPGALAAAADELLPKLAPLLGDLLVRLQTLEDAQAGDAGAQRVIPATPADPLRLAILLSGTGRTLDHLAAEIAAGRIPAQLVGVIASRADVRGYARARELGLPTELLRRRDFADVERYGDAIAAQLAHWRTELAAMAGFLQLWRIPPPLHGRVMNIHPALLPAFGGKGMHGGHVHAAVVTSGVKISGCTVHFADSEYDTGPIILQRPVPVSFDETPETLAARVFAEECVAYPEAIRLFAEGRLEIVGRRVRIAAPVRGASVNRRRGRSS